MLHRLRPLLVLVATVVTGCAHRGPGSAEVYLDANGARLVVGTQVPDLVDQYQHFTEGGVRPEEAAVRWLQQKPEDLASFERSARALASTGSTDEAAAAWLLMGNAWLFLSERGRNIPPPSYTDLRGAVVWDDIVSRYIDPRFADLEDGALARLRRSVELAQGRGPTARAAERSITAIEARRRGAPSDATATIGLRLLVEETPSVAGQGMNTTSE
jgi:hypothetical protein